MNQKRCLRRKDQGLNLSSCCFHAIAFIIQHLKKLLTYQNTVLLPTVLLIISVRSHNLINIIRLHV